MLTQLCLKSNSFLNEETVLLNWASEENTKAVRREGDTVTWAANGENNNNKSQRYLSTWSVASTISYILLLLLLVIISNILY